MAAETGTIVRSLQRSIERHASRTAVVFGEERISYESLWARIQASAAVFRDRLGGAGARVGMLLKNRPDYLSCYFGILLSGHVPFLLDASLNTGELEVIQDDCDLDALVVEYEGADRIGLREVGAAGQVGSVWLLRLERKETGRYALREDTEVCRFTSGTTGRPKCLEFAGRAVVAAAQNWVDGTRLASDDRVLCLAALSNGLAFNTSLLPVCIAGAELHLTSGIPLTRSVRDLITRENVTRLVAFPSLYRLLVQNERRARGDLAGLRSAISAGAPLWPEVRAEFRSRFGLDVSDYYGIAETGPCTFERDWGAGTGLGKPLPGVDLRIASPNEAAVGEVCVRTESMASGYLNHPGLFEARVDQEGFYHSGDMGRIEEGRLYLLGRTEDRINVGGRKVDPDEIAAMVLQMSGVRDAVAFADVDMMGETFVHLAVVVDGVTSAEILTTCRARLAPYKVPARVSMIDAVPRNEIGKSRISSLREQLARPRAAAVKDEP